MPKRVTLSEGIALVVVAMVAIIAACASMCRRPAPDVTPGAADSAKAEVYVDTTHSYTTDRIPGTRRRKPAAEDTTAKAKKTRHHRPVKSTKSATHQVRQRTLTPEQENEHSK